MIELFKQKLTDLEDLLSDVGIETKENSKIYEDACLFEETALNNANTKQIEDKIAQINKAIERQEQIAQLIANKDVTFIQNAYTLPIKKDGLIIYTINNIKEFEVLLESYDQDIEQNKKRQQRQDAYNEQRNLLNHLAQNTRTPSKLVNDILNKEKNATLSEIQSAIAHYHNVQTLLALLNELKNLKILHPELYQAEFDILKEHLEERLRDDRDVGLYNKVQISPIVNQDIESVQQAIDTIQLNIQNKNTLFKEQLEVLADRLDSPWPAGSIFAQNIYNNIKYKLEHNINVNDADIQLVNDALQSTYDLSDFHNRISEMGDIFTPEENKQYIDAFTTKLAKAGFDDPTLINFNNEITRITQNDIATFNNNINTILTSRLDVFKEAYLVTQPISRFAQNTYATLLAKAKKGEVITSSDFEKITQAETAAHHFNAYSAITSQLREIRTQFTELKQEAASHPSLEEMQVTLDAQIQSLLLPKEPITDEVLQSAQQYVVDASSNLDYFMRNIFTEKQTDLIFLLHQATYPISDFVQQKNDWAQHKLFNKSEPITVEDITILNSALSTQQLAPELESLIEECVAYTDPMYREAVNANTRINYLNSLKEGMISATEMHYAVLAVNALRTEIIQNRLSQHPNIQIPEGYIENAISSKQNLDQSIFDIDTAIAEDEYYTAKDNLIDEMQGLLAQFPNMAQGEKIRFQITEEDNIERIQEKIQQAKQFLDSGLLGEKSFRDTQTDKLKSIFENKLNILHESIQKTSIAVNTGYENNQTVYDQAVEIANTYADTFAKGKKLTQHDVQKIEYINQQLANAIQTQNTALHIIPRFKENVKALREFPNAMSSAISSEQIQELDNIELMDITNDKNILLKINAATYMDSALNQAISHLSNKNKFISQIKNLEAIINTHQAEFPDITSKYIKQLNKNKNLIQLDDPETWKMAKSFIEEIPTRLQNMEEYENSLQSLALQLEQLNSKKTIASEDTLHILEIQNKIRTLQGNKQFTQNRLENIHFELTNLGIHIEPEDWKNIALRHITEEQVTLVSNASQNILAELEKAKNTKAEKEIEEAKYAEELQIIITNFEKKVGIAYRQDYPLNYDQFSNGQVKGNISKATFMQFNNIYNTILQKKKDALQLIGVDNISETVEAELKNNRVTHPIDHIKAYDATVMYASKLKRIEENINTLEKYKMEILKLKANINVPYDLKDIADITENKAQLHNEIDLYIKDIETKIQSMQQKMETSVLSDIKSIILNLPVRRITQVDVDNSHKMVQNITQSSLSHIGPKINSYHNMINNYKQSEPYGKYLQQKIFNHIEIGSYESDADHIAREILLYSQYLVSHPELNDLQKAYLTHFIDDKIKHYFAYGGQKDKLELFSQQSHPIRMQQNLLELNPLDVEATLGEIIKIGSAYYSQPVPAAVQSHIPMIKQNSREFINVTLNKPELKGWPGFIKDVLGAEHTQALIDKQTQNAQRMAEDLFKNNLAFFDAIDSTDLNTESAIIQGLKNHTEAITRMVQNDLRGSVNYKAKVTAFYVEVANSAYANGDLNTLQAIHKALPRNAELQNLIQAGNSAVFETKIPSYESLISQLSSDTHFKSVKTFLAAKLATLTSNTLEGKVATNQEVPTHMQKTIPDTSPSKAAQRQNTFLLRNKKAKTPKEHTSRVEPPTEPKKPGGNTWGNKT